MKIDERPNQRERRRMMDDDVMGIIRWKKMKEGCVIHATWKYNSSGVSE
jgi:hypothetical protein